MSYNLVDPTTGDLTRVAGRGRAEYGASATRNGTVSLEVAAQSSGTATITFDIPMPDADYQVIFLKSASASLGRIGAKTVNGFNITVANLSDESITANIDYYAFKLYSDVEYSNIVNSIPTSASSSNKLTTMTEVKTMI